MVQKHVCASKKAPEEVVTDGYEGAIYVQCGRDDHIQYKTHHIAKKRSSINCHRQGSQQPPQPEPQTPTLNPNPKNPLPWTVNPKP